MDLWMYLKTVQKPIVLFGTGNGADKILDRLEALKISVSGVFVNDSFARKQMFRGFPVLTYEEASDRFGDMVVLLSFGTHLPEVISHIMWFDSEQEFYAPDVPLAGDELFTEAFYAVHESQFECVRKLLADAESTKVFDTVIQYKLTGKPAGLLSCNPECIWNLIPFQGEESYLDLGAYDGDTVRKFISYCPDYKAIYAVEPDGKNYEKLKRNTNACRNVEYYHCGISDSWKELPFIAGKGRGSALGGNDKIKFDSVDNLMLHRPVTFLKMDIEGMEAEGIRGAKNLIRRCHPKLLISAYHRTEDLFRIPLEVLDIYPGYRIFLRKAYSLPAWDIDYLFLPNSEG